jgi:DNA primase
VAASQPFVVFNVERILDRADTRTAEGKDRALGELRPMIRELGAGVLHDDLLRRVAGRLELTSRQLAALASEVSAPRAMRPGAGGGPASAGGAGGNGSGGDGAAQAVRSERLFLGLCIAVPETGARVLGQIDPDQLLTSGVLRRAARHLAEHIRAPLADLPPEDDDFARTMSALVDLAGRVPDPSPDRLEHARLILELERLDRAIIRARHEGAGTSALARDREAVRESMRSVVARLEHTL